MQIFGFLKMSISSYTSNNYSYDLYKNVERLFLPISFKGSNPILHSSNLIEFN